VSDSLLDSLLTPGGLSTVFQPIFEVREDTSRLYALECLSRGPTGTNLESPDVLFDYARRKHAEERVDRACVTTALRSARNLPGAPRLSINVHATTLGRDHEFVSFLGDEAEACGIPVDRLIVEVVEHVYAWDEQAFLNVVEGLRAIGVQLALDDIGRGHSNYRMILDCRPDYFKIDGYFVQGCRNDFYRQAVLESIAGLASKFAARVVAEAVEDSGDLSTLVGLGIDLVQGWLFGRAEPRPHRLLENPCSNPRRDNETGPPVADPTDLTPP
jgi:EAL domain-containing protein (putative c-di-GMP-specific phosphodiesterase class I)